MPGLLEILITTASLLLLLVKPISPLLYYVLISFANESLLKLAAAHVHIYICFTKHINTYYELEEAKLHNL